MNFPQIQASENAQYTDPISGAVTFIAFNSNTVGSPDYQWRRNATHSIVREFTPSDELRITQAALNAAIATGKVRVGTYDQMIIDTTAVVFIVEDPDEAVNSKYGGGYLQRQGDYYKIDSGATIAEIIAGIAAGTYDPNTGGGTGSGSGSGSGGSTGGSAITVGAFGIQIDGQTVIVPDTKYYQIQLVQNNVYTTVYEGNGTTTPITIVTPGIYNIINLTDGERTENVAIPQSYSTGSGSGGTGSGTGAGSGTGGATTTPVGSDGVEVGDGIIRLTKANFYQIQYNFSPYESKFQGNGPKDVALASNTYNVINLTTGARTVNVVVENSLSTGGSTAGVIGQACPAYTGSGKLAAIPANPGLTHAVYTNSVEFFWPLPPSFNVATERAQVCIDGIVRYQGTGGAFLYPLSAGAHSVSVRIINDSNEYGPERVLNFTK